MPLKQKKKNIQSALFMLAVFVIASGIFFVGGTESARATAADTIAGTIGDALVSNINPVALVFKGLLYAVWYFCSLLLSVGVTLFMYVIRPDHTALLMNGSGVYVMWKFVRDFFNLFFILVLLFSALATVFQIEKYNYKKILLNLVLMALLVNFSFPISRLIIDFTNVPMYFFANQIDAVTNHSGALGPFLGASQLDKILLPKKVFSDFSDLLSAIVFTFLFAVSIIVLAVMMLVRLLALVILVIFSSVGFAATVIPGLEKYSGMWWDKLWQYTLFGPAAMLMLLVSVHFLTDIRGSKVMDATGLTSGADTATLVSGMAKFAIPIILLWFTLGLANSFSIAGAGAVVGMGQKFSKWAGRSSAGFGYRKYEKFMTTGKKSAVTKYFAPTVLKDAVKGWSAESEHRDHAPVELAAAGVQDTLNSVSSRVANTVNPWNWKNFGKATNHTDHKFATAMKQAAEKEKEMTTTTNDESYLAHETANALHNGETGEMVGGLRALAKGNGLNTYMTEQGKNYIGKKDKDGKPIVETETGADGEQKVVVSSANMRSLLKQMLIDSGMRDKEEIAKQMMAIGETATNAGNYAFGGMTTFDDNLDGKGKSGFRLTKSYRAGEIDPHTGKPREKDGDEQADWAAAKVKNLESQKRQTTIHPDSMFTRTEEGFGDINGDVARAIIGTFTNGDVTEARRSRDDMKQAIYDAYDKQLPEFMKMYNDKDNLIFKAYVDTIRELKDNPKQKTPGAGAGASKASKEANQKAEEKMI